MVDLKSILVIDFGGVGDLVLAIPFLRGLKTSVLSPEVSLLCAERAGGILRDQPYVDNLYLSSITISGLLAIGVKLRRKRFDVAVNLMPETSLFSAVKMYLLFRVINAKQWVGRDTEGRGFFYDIKIPEEKMQVENEVLLYGKILAAISDGFFDENLEFHVSPANSERAEKFLAKKRKRPKDPLVLINPGSDWPAKRWPIARYVEVLKQLAELFPVVEFGVIGTKKEIGLAHVLKKQVVERVFVLSGKTPLEILPAILKRASLLITNDSGPAHLARAVGTPVVILAGPGAPAYFAIKGQDESIVVHHPVPCAPCLKVTCDTMECWKAISVDEVVTITSRMLKGRISAVNS